MQNRSHATSVNNKHIQVIIHIFMSCSISPGMSTHSPRAHHSQFDIYPHHLIEADQKLHNLQQSLAALVSTTPCQLSFVQLQHLSTIHQTQALPSQSKTSSQNPNFFTAPIQTIAISSSSNKRTQPINGAEFNRWAMQDEQDRVWREQNIERAKYFQQKLLGLHKNISNQQTETWVQLPLEKQRSKQEENKKQASFIRKLVNSQSDIPEYAFDERLFVHDKRLRKFAIQRVFQLEKYYYKSEQLDKDTYQSKTIRPNFCMTKIQSFSSRQQQDQESTKFPLLVTQIKNLLKSMEHIKASSEIDIKEQGSILQMGNRVGEGGAQESLIQQKQILEMLSRVGKLNEEVKKNQVEASLRNNEKVERLFDVIRSMIINFKISLRSMERIISMKESREVNKNKYMHLKEYLAALYKVLEQESALKNDIAQRSSHILNENAQMPGSLPVQLYQNHQEKVEKLSSELSKVRMQLDYRTKQFEELKAATSQTNAIRKQVKVQPTQPGLEEYVQILVRELEQQKRKCIQYETQATKTERKKTEKVIFIRK